MANVASHLRGAFVSPEMIVIAVALYMLVDTPEMVVRTANAIAAGPDVVKYIALLPAGVLIWSIPEAKSILLPGEDTKALLLNWPRYSYLKSRVVTGLVFQLLFATVAFFAWAYSPSFSVPKSFVAASMSVIGSLICGATFVLASITVRGIVKRVST